MQTRRSSIVVLLLLVLGVGCDRSKNEEEYEITSVSEDFAVLHVDDENVDFTPGAAAFPYFGRTALPEAATTAEIYGIESLLHPDRNALVAYFRGKVPDDHRIGYLKVDHLGAGAHTGKWQALYLHDKSIVTGRHIAKAAVAIDTATSRPYVAIVMTDEGRKRFADFTRQRAGQRVAVTIGETVESAPLLNEPVPDGRLMFNFGSLLSFEEAMGEAMAMVKSMEGTPEVSE